MIDHVREMTPIRDGVIHGYPSMYEIETGKIIFLGLDRDGEPEEWLDMFGSARERAGRALSSEVSCC